MDLFWFFVQQFKVPILAILIMGGLLLIRIYVLPVKPGAAPQDSEQAEPQNHSGK